MPSNAGPRRTRPLSTAQSLGLLRSTSLGRIVFTQHALPVIRPVNHLVDGTDVIIRSHVGAAVLATHGQVVVYEADALDPDTHLGWSVIVTGPAHVVADPQEIVRYARVIQPWVDLQMDYVIRISIDSITGLEVLDESDHLSVGG